MKTVLINNANKFTRGYSATYPIIDPADYKKLVDTLFGVDSELREHDQMLLIDEIEKYDDDGNEMLDENGENIYQDVIRIFDHENEMGAMLYPIKAEFVKVDEVCHSSDENLIQWETIKYTFEIGPSDGSYGDHIELLVHERWNYSDPIQNNSANVA